MSAKRISAAVLVIVVVIAALAIVSFSPKSSNRISAGASTYSSSRPALTHWPHAPASPHPNTDVLAYRHKYPGPGR